MNKVITRDQLLAYLERTVDCFYNCVYEEEKRYFTHCILTLVLLGEAHGVLSEKELKKYRAIIKTDFLDVVCIAQ